MKDQSAAAAFAALGNPHRVRALRLLVRAGEDGLNVGAIRAALGLPASTLAHHLTMLVEAGLVWQEKVGRELISRANYERIRDLNAFLMKDCCRGVFRDAPAA